MISDQSSEIASLPFCPVLLTDVSKQHLDLFDLESAFVVVSVEPDFALIFVVRGVLEPGGFESVEDFVSGSFRELEDEQAAFLVGEFLVTLVGAGGPAAEAGVVGFDVGHGA